MAMNLNKRLAGSRKGEPLELPVGGDFATGLIGPTLISLVWTCLTESNPVSYNKSAPDDERIEMLSFQKTRSGKYRMFFETRELAQAALDLLGTDNSFPSFVVRVEVDNSRVLNFSSDKARAAFGDTLDNLIEVKSLTRSKKRRHSFHLIWLPAFVSAVARSMGAEFDPYDLSALLDAAAAVRGDNPRPVDEVFTDEFFQKMCGDPDDKDGWKDSVLGIQRAALWALLGETDPANYNMSGRAKTEAEELRACLDWLFTWDNPLWCRVDLVPNPSLDGDGRYESDDGPKHRSIACITEFFDSEADALKVAQSEMSAVAKAEKEEETADAADKPDLPGGEWEGIEEASWIEALESANDMSVPQAAKELDAPIAAISKWRAYLAG